MKYLKLFCFLMVLMMSQTAGAFTLHVTDDTYTTSKFSKGKNYGDQNKIVVKRGHITGYVRFDITTIQENFAPENIISAKLRLYITKVESEGQIRILSVFQDWEEGKLSDNDNLSGSYPYQTVVFLEGKTGLNKHSFLYLNVTDSVKAAMTNGLPFSSFMLYGNDDNIYAEFATKESGGNAPQLEILFGRVGEN